MRCFASPAGATRTSELRHAIVQSLAERGPATSAELAERMALPPAAVRHLLRDRLRAGRVSKFVRLDGPPVWSWRADPRVYDGEEG